MIDKTDRIVDGFCYANVQEADLARQELEKTEILAKKLDGLDITAVKAIYERAIINRTFRTPVGHKFLHSLRSAILAKGVAETEVLPIPLQVHFIQAEPVQYNPKKSMPVEKKKGNKKDKKAHLAISVLLNIVLIIAVMAMFMITLYSDNPNILNYKSQIQNEYASWEQDLSNREKELAQRERELEEMQNEMQNDN